MPDYVRALDVQCIEQAQRVAGHELDAERTRLAATRADAAIVEADAACVDGTVKRL